MNQQVKKHSNRNQRMGVSMKWSILLLVCVLLLSGTRRISAETNSPQSVYNVNLTSDGGDANPGDGVCDSDLSSGGAQCTIRAAIEESNETIASDIVAIPAGTYDISGDALEVTGGVLTILGAFNGGTILDGTNSDSGILFVRDGATVDTTLLTFQNASGGSFPGVGGGIGGAITNQGDLTLRDCVVRDNRVSANGGGIVNNQTMLIEDCLIENNRSGQVGGGIYSSGYDFPNSTTVRDTIIRNNLSTGGGGLYVADANVLLDNVTVEHNAAFGTPARNSYGGGMSVKSSSEPFVTTIQNSTFADNFSEASGGAIFTSNELIISASEFRHNRAALRGGAIFSQIKETVVANSLFYGNVAGYDGGAFFQNTDDLTISSSAIFDNQAVNGAGLYVKAYAGETTLENVTISGNVATQEGGGLYVADEVTARYVTIADNSAESGAAIAISETANVSFGSAIIADHITPVCENDGGTFTSAGHNVFESTAGCNVTAVSGDQFGADADLGTLRDNGGARVTLTHSLGEDSAALEGGDSADCPSFDQRGVVRPVNGLCDAGALEHDPSQSAQAWSPTPPLPTFQYATFPTLLLAGTTFTVDTTDNVNHSDDNPGDGACATGAGECTLRAAIQESNALAGRNTIMLPAGTYTATSQLDEITDHLIIDGAGRDSTELLRTGSSGAFRIDYGTLVTIRDLTMGGAGRFISNYGSLTLENCVLQNNSDSSVFMFYNYGDTMPTIDPLPELRVDDCIFRDNVGAFNGAAIQADGYLQVSNSLFENNEATNGGAIYSTGGAGVTRSGDMTIINSRFEGNSAENQGGAIRSRWNRTTISNTIFIDNTVTGGSQPQGGAIAMSSWLTITDSYFEGNVAQYAGGAIANGGNWNLDIDPAIVAISGSAFVENRADFGGGLVWEGSGSLVNSTFSGNTALSDGGGILIAAGSTGTLNSLTIVNNIADSDFNNDGAGGGLRLSPGLWDDPGSFTIENSVIADNSAFSGADCNAAVNTGVSLGSNLIVDVSECAIFTNGSDLIGDDPQLTPLVNVGNHNRVHLPLPTSPLVDSGANCQAVDQRGALRGVCDRGSAEIGSPITFAVNDGGADDDSEPGDGLCQTNAGVCTFAAAVQEANAWNFADAITLPEGTFASDDIVIKGGDLTISGAGADKSTLRANLVRAGNSRVLSTGTELDSGQQIVLQDLAISGGNLPAFLAQSGGGILNKADLTLNRVSIHGNRGGFGGGIANSDSGRLTIVDSAISDNTAQWLSGRGYGGGLFNSSSQAVTLTNVTVSSNQAAQYGGGVVHGGGATLTLDQVTVAANTASPGYGGGIVNSGGGVLALDNSIIADNSDAASDPDCYGSVQVVRSRVLIESNSTNCLPNSTVLTGDPGLSVLAMNGGSTPTHAIGAVSSAVDAGGSNCPTADQRGYGRSGECDLGAYEFAGVPTAVGLSGHGVGTNSADILFIFALLLITTVAVASYNRQRTL